MRSTELRIGNWVEIKDQEVKTYAQVEGIGNLQQVAGQLWSIEELVPIPLTEEWLVRFGFEKHSGIYFRTLNYSAYIAIGNDGSCGLYNSLSDYNRGNSFNQMKQIDFVHQLQNLYHALTGEELEMKP